MIIKCSRDLIKKFLLYKQFLFYPRELVGIRGIETVFNSLRAIQYDPQNPCGRSVDLFLQARVKGIHPGDYYSWLYEQRKGIETYDKELTVVPIEDLPLCRGVFPKSRRIKLNNFLRSNEEALKELLKHIETKGPICSSDLEESKTVDIFWEPARWSKAALDSLWKIGRLVIAYRKNGRKYYDLPHRVYGNKFIWRNPLAEAELQDECVIRRIQSIGLLPVSGGGSAWLGIGSGKEITAVLSKLIKEGKITMIDVPEVGERYIVNSADLNLLESLEHKEPSKRMSFLPPLDNLLWDRKMIKDIFGFEYKWEAYTPIGSREFGHYVLPVLYGSEFIGRIEPKYNPAEKRLEIKGFWIEPTCKWDKEKEEALKSYLDEFHGYLGIKSKRKFIALSSKRVRDLVFLEKEKLESRNKGDANKHDFLKRKKITRPLSFRPVKK